MLMPLCGGKGIPVTRGEILTMPAISSLYELIEADLEKVCAIFDDELFSKSPVLNDLCTHIRQYRGKMLRPGLLLLSGRACGKITDEHLTLAAVVELVHMATLVHDDVLDDADIRRRCMTVNRRKGNEAAVLLGDYLISHAFHLCSSLDSQFASRTIGLATNTICEGEMQQVHYRANYGLTKEQYLQIISRKTATLTSTCCLLGAHFAGASAEVVHALEQYGLNVGIAFQITDDVLDIIGTEERMGKTLGRDLEKQKMTLPLIHGLNGASKGSNGRLRQIVTADHPDRNELCELLTSAGSIDYALETARQYVDTANTHLEALEASYACDTLQRMANLAVDREQ